MKSVAQSEPQGFKSGLASSVVTAQSSRNAARRELKAEGISPDATEQFLWPIGLSIGLNQPAEIAISIVVQLIEHRDVKKERCGSVEVTGLSEQESSTALRSRGTQALSGAALIPDS